MQKLYRRAIRQGLLALTFLLWSVNYAAASETVAYPATGFWNGYLNHLNVVECNNFGGSKSELKLNLRNRSGGLLAEKIFEIPALGTVHVVLNSLAELRDSYGTYHLDLTSGSDGRRLRCLTAIYRLSTRPQRSVDYAFALPVRDPLTGLTAGLFNSMDPETTSRSVQNWLSIYNPSADQFDASLQLYDFDGVLQSDRAVRLAAGERLDLALGHDNARSNGRHVGMYKIVPERSDAPYAAFLSRYGVDATGPRFAFPLTPSAGSCTSLSGFAATVNNGENWAELANVGDAEVELTVAIHDRAGAARGSERIRLAPGAQHHLFLNRALGAENVGSFRITCEGTGAKIIAQSLVYGRSSDRQSVNWAYASQLRENAGDPDTRLGIPANTYLGMQNWLKIANRASGAADFRLELFAPSGARASEDLLKLPESGTFDIGLHATFGSNAVGEGLIAFPDPGSSVAAELLRVFPDSRGGVESIMLIPAALLPETTVSVELEPVASGFIMPTGVVAAGDGTNRLFVIEREGRIRIIKNGSVNALPFLDISEKVSTEGEMGLLGLVFHPAYAQNGRFFVVYNDILQNTILAEFAVSDLDPDTADEASETSILTIPQPHVFHKGGQLAFGPDGYLYASLGDGGFSGDPLGNGQNLGTLLGKILRLDVSQIPYSIPPDNPFIAVSGARPEIWAYGFRNPWRFSFDRLNGDLIAGDVGENLIEEINLVERGGNYGWSRLEGRICFPSGSCSTEGTILPVSEYRHSEGIAVIGGFVYRGTEIPSLSGRYVFSDYVSGRLWSLERTPNNVWLRSQIGTLDFYVSAFGEDEAGELYIVNFFGQIFRIRNRQ